MTVLKNLFFCWLVMSTRVYSLQAQTLAVQLQNAVKNLESDLQLKHGIIGFSVLETKTGKLVFERNAQIGLAAASCQKVLTSGAAFEFLGKDYRYKTELGYNGTMKDSVLNGDLFIIGSGDPTLGSWRYASTADSILLKRWVLAVRKAGIKSVTGRIVADDSKFSHQLIPGGWIWDDVGNYYGAGAGAMNWRENQYDLILRSGKKPGDRVEVVSVFPENTAGPFLNELKSAEAGSGDQAFIYLPALKNLPLLNGTIPVQHNKFSISGSVINPTERIQKVLTHALTETGISSDQSSFYSDTTKPSLIFDTYLSPPLDSINYWFLKRSINLYGEALIKTIAYEKAGKGSTQKGIELVRDFWSGQGIDKSAINMLDGSGLSPQNRITADALVKVMQYARSRPWFTSFYDALPEINGLKMKSGSIGGARSFTGYSKSKVGNEYTFAIIVNNYDGSAVGMVRKIYALLNILK